METPGRRKIVFRPTKKVHWIRINTTIAKDHRGRPLRDAYSLLDDGIQEEEDEQDNDANDIKVRFSDVVTGVLEESHFTYTLRYYPANFLFIGILCWLIVFTIPMAKITNTMNDHMRRHPLALDYELEKDYYKRVERTPRKKNQVILLCTYRCCGFHYYKYTIDGTNIFS